MCIWICPADGATAGVAVDAGAAVGAAGTGAVLLAEEALPHKERNTAAANTATEAAAGMQRARGRGKVENGVENGGIGTGKKENDGERQVYPIAERRRYGVRDGGKRGRKWGNDVVAIVRKDLFLL